MDLISEALMSSWFFRFSELYKKYHYLLDCAAIDEDDKAMFRKLKAREADETLVTRSISLLMRMLETYYGKTVILLIDEYDVPIAGEAATVIILRCWLSYGA